MNNRKMLKYPFTVLVAVMLAVLLANCGSNENEVTSGTVDPEFDAVPVPMLLPEGVFTVDDVAAAGWKKSKELSSETLPEVIEVWYGFYNQRDVEVRIYASHEVAISVGMGPADTATGRGKPAPFAVGGISATRKSYGAYGIVGNLVLLCEVKIEDCESLLNSVK